MNKTIETQETAPATITPFRALTLDVAHYQAILDDANIPDDEKRELITAIWAIITTFVDLGYGIHPIQNPDILASATKELPTTNTERPAP